MKFRIRELTPGYRLEVAVPTCQPNVFRISESDPLERPIQVGVTWVPVGHPYGSIQSAKHVAEEFARGGNVVEEFDVEAHATAKT